MSFSGILRRVVSPSPLLFAFALIVVSLLTRDSASVRNQLLGAVVVRQVPFPLFPPLLVRPSVSVQFGSGAQVLYVLAVIFALLFFLFLSALLQLFRAVHVAMTDPGERLL